MIYLVSDGTCRTCEQVVQAVLVQYPHAAPRLVRKAHVRQVETIRKVVQSAAKNEAMIFYTLISPRARYAIAEAARERDVRAVDLLAPVLTGLYDLFGAAPEATPGVFYESNRAQFDRIDAVEYTLAHDDGRHTQDLYDADVVLVGVSRAAKSTTCFFLAYSGIRAANVPLFPDAAPPAELLRLGPRRVIGLTVNPIRLQSVREARLHGWRMDANELYAQREQIAKELRAAREQMDQYGWRYIDASYKAIEEIAREVRQLLAESGIVIGERTRRPST